MYYVLFEQREDDAWCGYTGNYIRVAARSPEELENAIRPVRLDQIHGDVVVGTIQDG